MKSSGLRPLHEGFWKVAGTRLLEQKAELGDAGKASVSWHESAFLKGPLFFVARFDASLTFNASEMTEFR